MAFSKDYATILFPFVRKYQDAKNEKGRTEVLKNASDAVLKAKEMLEDGGADLPKDLKAVCDPLF
jgi:hypothetical protein